MAAASVDNAAIKFKSAHKNGDGLGYYYPAASGDIGILVVQEWWGANEHMKSRAKEFAAAGLHAVVPDMYRGEVAKDRERAGHLMSGLDWTGAMEDLRGAADFLKSKGVKQVYITGYCLGGALSLAAAANLGKEVLAGAIAYYGIPKPQYADLNKISVPVQLHFGSKDAAAGFSDPKAADALEEVLKKNGVQYEFFRYEGMQHAFTNPTRPEVYNAKAAHEAFVRTVAFCRQATGVVHFESSNKAGEGQGAYFPVANSTTAVVCVQEWWGLNQQIREQAQQFQKAGYSTLVPDLYRGKTAIDHEHAGHLMTGLDWPGAVADIKGAANYLRKLGAKKVFVIGYCMGGALSLAAAVLLADVVNGAIVNYGIPPKQLADATKLTLPVQLHFGTKDSMAGFTDPKAQDALEAELKTTKAHVEFYRYEGLEHAFSNTTGPHYDAKGAALALERALQFIAKQ